MWKAYVSQLKSCAELDTEHMSLLVKLQDGDLIRTLFGHLGNISKPTDGANHVIILLAVVARYATWLPDRMTVRCERLKLYSRLIVQCGSGPVIERLWPSAMFRAPLEEFETLAEQICRRKSSPLILKREIENGVVQTLILEMKHDVAKSGASRQIRKPQKDVTAFLRSFETEFRAPAPPAKTKPQEPAVDTHEIDDDWE